MRVYFEFTPKKYDSEGGNYKLAALPSPATNYDLTYVNAGGEKGLIRIGDDGKVLAPMVDSMRRRWCRMASWWCARTSAAWRITLDLSGMVWLADRVYKAGAAAPPAGGELGRDGAGRAHTRMGL